MEMNENYNIILFCIDYAVEHATAKHTQEQILAAKEWLDRMMAHDHEAQARIGNEIITELEKK